jgi:hypothetical protein
MNVKQSSRCGGAPLTEATPEPGMLAFPHAQATGALAKTVSARRSLVTFERV